MDNDKYFSQVYMPKMNRLGKITGYLGVLFSFIPVSYLAWQYGLVPQGSALFASFITAAASFGVLWVVEPISYFPVLGPIGTYMAFLSGNISNMRVPCASMAQKAAKVEPGTEQGSVVSAIGMAVSVIINIAVLTVGVVLGASVLEKLPPNVTQALNFLLPALFGALLVQFGLKFRKHACFMLVFAIAIAHAVRIGLFNWLPGAANYLPMLSTVFISIIIALMVHKKKA